MDYLIVLRNRSVIVLLLLLSFVHCGFSILNRDIILTPKQGLQLSGKRIYYDEITPSSDSYLRNDHSETLVGARPWERTLKHVTYITLFTNVAGGGGIITGNFSKIKEYNEFLNSPYVSSPIPIDSRFGDIVTMAQGRLEYLSNGTYRFVEGNCDYECARENNMIAIWHVEKIRHRDGNRKFQYEMKFIVSPVTLTSTSSESVVRGGPNKRTTMDKSYNRGQNYNVQTFIQKEDDYPLSFSKILNENEDEFADRRYDASRSFRQVTHQPYNPVTPIPQSTFLRGVYRAPPGQLTPHGPPRGPKPPLAEHLNLNIGEYYNKGSYASKSASKIELFPNLLTMMFGKPPQYATPHSTFRPPPLYAMKFPRPDIYTVPPIPHIHQHPELLNAQRPEVYNTQTPASFPYHEGFAKTPEYYQSQNQFAPKIPQNSLVAHHYHHHFLMSNGSKNGGISNEGENGEQQIQNPAELYKNVQLQDVTPQPQFAQVYEEPTFDEQLKSQQHIHRQQQQQSLDHLQQLPQLDERGQHSQMPPAKQKFVFPTTQIEQQRVIHITPIPPSIPPLRKPQYQQLYYHQQFPKFGEQYASSPGAYVSYPSTTQTDRYDLPTPRNKPFVQSQPLDETTIRYSEPDPLYAHINDKDESSTEKGEQQHKDNNGNEPQLELPQDYEQNTEQEAEYSADIANEQTIEAQVQAPQSHKNTSPSFYQQDTPLETSVKTKHLQKTSESTIKISTEKATDNTIETEASNTITLAATARPKYISVRPKRVRVKVTKLTGTTTTKPKTFSTKETTEGPTSMIATASTNTTTSKTTTAQKHQQQFVSSSTTESPLKSISRLRNSNKRFTTSTTTTEKPVLKWKARRKEANGKALNLKQLIQANQTVASKSRDSKLQSSDKDLTGVSVSPTTSKTELPADETTPNSNDLTTSEDITLGPPLPSTSTASTMEVFEVLTQKSVSKSIKFATSGNGQEIPIIINESANEVKTT